MIAFEIQLTLEPLYVPKTIRDTMSAFLVIMLATPGPIAVFILYLCKKFSKPKKKKQMKTGDLFKLFLEKKVIE
jgi:hypothetical protein